ncbi:sugar kinase [Prauserella cavernicola]|uniref:Sugar kinase n=1 Tax=Prauserella cavernicola TaxID=2800127 RepID=A0A934V424_9PSEU|nr:sugar kinase [Prauserella cavernicola]MBK1784299.1 sugar kinase [Prauserella cavernicola]
MDLVGIGEPMVLVQPPAGETLSAAASFEVHVAGAELNACAAAAVLGSSTVLCTRLGADPFAARVRDAADALGVALDAESDPDRPTGLFAKDALPDGRRRVHYYRAGSAASALDVADGVRALRHRPRAVLVSGLTAALGPGPQRLVTHVATHAAEHGSSVVVDVNLRPALDPRGSAVPTLRAILPHTDVLLVGTDEAEPLFGTTDPAEIVRRSGVREVVVKAGPEGCWWSTDGGEPRHQPSLATSVVDPVGAGDAFAGGYLAARLAGASGGAAARLGSRLAADVLARTGDTAGLPDRARAAELLVETLREDAVS